MSGFGEGHDHWHRHQKLMEGGSKNENLQEILCQKFDINRVRRENLTGKRIHFQLGGLRASDALWEGESGGMFQLTYELKSS